MAKKNNNAHPDEAGATPAFSAEHLTPRPPSGLSKMKSKLTGAVLAGAIACGVTPAAHTQNSSRCRATHRNRTCYSQENTR